MSKQTKIIAIVGGVLILVGLIYIGAGKGGFKGAFQAMGCGKGDKSAPRSAAANPEDLRINDCKAVGFIFKRDDKGAVIKDGGKPVKDSTKNCATVVTARCSKDAAFKKANGSLCRKFAKAAEPKDEE
jgi:hypothetical protein